jgi:hypothetical protein
VDDDLPSAPHRPIVAPDLPTITYHRMEALRIPPEVSPSPAEQRSRISVVEPAGDAPISIAVGRSRSVDQRDRSVRRIGTSVRLAMTPRGTPALKIGQSVRRT